MPYTIFKDFTFAAAHHIPDHPGKCRFLHGHNYKVRVHLRAEKLDRIGMVLDFADLKRLTEDVVGPWDHQVINDFPPFDTLPPTAEMLASHIYEAMAARLEDPRVSIARVEVWESESSCAVYEP
jgi:6-pyruvoyltetrahydropterin/6-carboxytetrahydropterin synthase